MGSQRICVDLPESFDNQVSSVQCAGGRDGIPAFDVFSSENYTGYEQMTYDNIDKIYIGHPKSFLMTGCQPWTVYPHKYFEGEGVCIKPNTEGKIGQECQPTFVPSL